MCVTITITITIPKRELHPRLRHDGPQILQEIHQKSLQQSTRILHNLSNGKNGFAILFGCSTTAGFPSRGLCRHPQEGSSAFSTTTSSNPSQEIQLATLNLLHVLLFFSTGEMALSENEAGHPKSGWDYHHAKNCQCYAIFLMKLATPHGFNLAHVSTDPVR